MAHDNDLDVALCVVSRLVWCGGGDSDGVYHSQADHKSDGEGPVCTHALSSDCRCFGRSR